MRLGILKEDLLPLIVLCLSACTPLAAQNQTFAGRSALGSPPVVSPVQIFVGRAEPAERVTVVSGQGHFPVACLLKNGQIAVILRGGAPHVGIKGRLDLVTSQNGGQTWSVPRTVASSHYDNRNPAFGQLSDGTLVLAYVEEQGSFDATGLREGGRDSDKVAGVFVVRSADSGVTWSSPYKIDISGSNSFSPFGKIIQSADGTALMAIYTSRVNATPGGSYLYRSRDNGRTWGDRSLIAIDYNETGIVSLPDGRLLAAVRAEKGGHMAMTSSSDQGRTWSEPRLMTQDAEMPGDLIVLRDGSVLFTYGERQQPCGVRALISRDGGNSWDKDHLIIVADDAPTWDSGYPSSLQLSDGRILTVYYTTQTAYDPRLPTDVLARTLKGAKAEAVIWSAPHP